MNTSWRANLGMQKVILVLLPKLWLTPFCVTCIAHSSLHWTILGFVLCPFHTVEYVSFGSFLIEHSVNIRHSKQLGCDDRILTMKSLTEGFNPWKYTPFYENGKIERQILQWRLLLFRSQQYCVKKLVVTSHFFSGWLQRKCRLPH